MPDIKMNSGYGLPELNRFAMSDGMLLGAFGLVVLAAALLVLPLGFAGLVGMFSVAGWIILLVFCSKRRAAYVLRNATAWSFGKAYIHSLLTELYGSAWVALATYVWFRFFDRGYFVDNMIALAQRPEMQQAVLELERGGMLQDLYLTTGTDNFAAALEAFRNISPETYCGMVVSWTLIAAPIAALLVALICKKYR